VGRNSRYHEGLRLKSSKIWWVQLNAFGGPFRRECPFSPERYPVKTQPHLGSDIIGLPARQKRVPADHLAHLTTVLQARLAKLLDDHPILREREVPNVQSW